MNILLISTDLLIQSRVAAAAMRMGAPPPRVVHCASVVTSSDAANGAIVILDLSTTDLDVAQAVPALRERLPESTPILAFAPHVHTAKLAAARDAGCDQVLSRGQLDRELEAVLQRWLVTSDAPE